MTTSWKYLLAGLSIVLFLPALNAQPKTSLKRNTLEAFHRYVSQVEREVETALSGENRIELWADRGGPSALKETRGGQIYIEQVKNVPQVPDGIVHDWIGVVFVPEVTAKDTINLLVDYDIHHEIYDEVIESRTLEKNGDTIEGYLLLRKERVLTVILDTEHTAEIHQLTDDLWSIFSRSTRVAEVRDYGTPDAEELPVDRGSGFMWRLNAYWSILQEQGGVWLECRTISLSRDIPWGLGWVIGPIVESLPREALEKTLQATRLVLHQEKQEAE